MKKNLTIDLLRDEYKIERILKNDDSSSQNVGYESEPLRDEDIIRNIDKNFHISDEREVP